MRPSYASVTGSREPFHLHKHRLHTCTRKTRRLLLPVVASEHTCLESTFHLILSSYWKHSLGKWYAQLHLLETTIILRGRIFELPPHSCTCKSCKATVAQRVPGLDVGQICDESNAKRNRDGWPWANAPDDGSSTQRRIAGDDGDNRFAEASCKQRPHARGDRLKKDNIPVTSLMISQCRAPQSNQTDTVQKGD